MVVQPDGKVVAGGFRIGGDPNTSSFVLARYNLDGSLDTDPTTGFGDGGKVTTLVGGGSPSIILSALALQSDGKIVAAGGNKIVRYNDDGSLDDTGFGTDGIQTLPSPVDVKAVAVAPDGRIVVAGLYRPVGGGTEFMVARFNSDGSPDTGFGTDGIQTPDFPGGDASAYGVAVQSNGKIVAAGDANLPTGKDFALVRYNTDGSLDGFFSGDGKQTTDFAGGNGADDIVLLPDGKVLVAGYSESTTDTLDDFAVARYTPAGELDPSFDGDGRQTIDFVGDDGVGGRYDYGEGIALQQNGMAVVAGVTYDPEFTGDFAVARLTAAGALDTTFAGDGTQTIDFSVDFPRDDSGNDVAIAADGKVVVAGGTGYSDPATGTQLYDFALARLVGNAPETAKRCVDGQDNDGDGKT
ncbi:MAG: hypothetical protein LC777_21195, partial [Actinobacteria bacterium]|nr:hypothetical protein [Actinomycetota bacterium]